jgi:hypothetical protein
MKPVHASLKIVAMLALVILGAGCASEFQNKKDLAIAAGFKVITPVQPDHVALLPTLPKGQVTQIKHDSKTYYILPDAENHQAYVGGPAEYQAYEKLRIAKKISEDNLAAAQMNQMAAMNWGAWGGWGTMGYPYVGGYGRMGPYYR